ncbi:MAG: DUF4906 domain-containing protein [Bacteroidales bacterium]|nr:DUF4906 domain-containing protein [Bacteroidales bacterium]
MKSRAILLSLLSLTGCTGLPPQAVEVPLYVETAPETRSADPDEGRISDLNLFLFNGNGFLEERKYLKTGQLDGEPILTLRVLGDETYTAFVCANIGYALPCSSYDELMAFRYHMAYPDEYSRGMPMTGRLTFTADGSAVRIPLVRMMTRVDLSVDRTALDPGIRFSVRRIRVGNAPSSALLFGESRAETTEQLFLQGFSKDGIAVEGLNRDVTLGHSREVPVYLLENLQEGPVPETASYIEAEIDYYSDTYISGPDQYLIYRFYLGESGAAGRAERNCRYPVVIRPEGDGLHGDAWRVDRSKLGIHPSALRFDLSPAAYNERQPGDSIRLRLDLFPPDTPVTIENLGYEDENIAAVYDYRIHPDGHGITLFSKKHGTAHVIFSAGPPVSRDTLAFVVFHP